MKRLFILLASVLSFNANAGNFFVGADYVFNKLGDENATSNFIEIGGGYRQYIGENFNITGNVSYMNEFGISGEKAQVIKGMIGLGYGFNVGSIYVNPQIEFGRAKEINLNMSTNVVGGTIELKKTKDSNLGFVVGFHQFENEKQTKFGIRYTF